MIKSLTPYYVSIPFVSPLTSLTCTAYTFRLYIWDGLKSSPPSTPSYEITKKNPTASTGNDTLNIARVVNDFVDFVSVNGTVTELVDGQNQVWVKWDTLYETTNPLDASTPSNANTQLMLQGYGYGIEGQNPQPPTNKILIPVIDYKVNRAGFFNIPILINETTTSLATLEITNITSISGDQYELSYTSTGSIDDIFYRYRLDGDTEWISGFDIGIESPFAITLPIVPGDYEVQIYSYDNINAEYIYSNIFDITI